MSTGTARPPHDGDCWHNDGLYVRDANNCQILEFIDRETAEDIGDLVAAAPRLRRALKGLLFAMQLRGAPHHILMDAVTEAHAAIAESNHPEDRTPVVERATPDVVQTIPAPPEPPPPLPGLDVARILMEGAAAAMKKGAAAPTIHARIAHAENASIMARAAAIAPIYVETPEGRTDG